MDPGKLSSVDDHGDRITIIPAEVRGFFRRHRDWTQIVLLVIFLALPWIKIGSYQSILLDIPKREFSFFGLLLKAHETPLLFFLLASAALGLCFVTSIWGRVWCGWTCPQTVFIDAVYRRIEKWVEGNYIERRKLQQESFNITKFRKKSFKWFLFVVVSSAIAHSFMAYFVGSRDLIQMLQNNPLENWNYFLLVLFFTGLVLFDFAWFREQFCIIMCPYGRFQSVLMEPNTLTVAYDVQRGEPRRGVALKGEKTGDCVSCNRCVEVCPTGIDIRNGLQLECIACTACIDACDDIMRKVQKPTGLISYNTMTGKKASLKNFKSISYLVAILLCLGGLSLALITRAPVDVAILRAGGLPYTILDSNSDSSTVINHFKLHLHNQTSMDALYEIALTEQDNESLQLITAQNPIALPKNSEITWHFFVKASPEVFKLTGKKKIQISLRNKSNVQEPTNTKEVILVGPQ